MIRLHSEMLWHQIKSPGIETNNFRLMSRLAMRASTEELVQQFERTMLDDPPAAVRLGIMAVMNRKYDNRAQSEDVRELVADRAGEFLTMEEQLTAAEMSMAQFLIAQLGNDVSPLVRAYLAESTDSAIYQ